MGCDVRQLHVYMCGRQLTLSVCMAMFTDEELSLHESFYVAQMVSGDVALIVKWNTGTELFRASMEGIRIGPINDKEHDIYFLFKGADCPLS